MLKSLNIENIAIIEKASVEFSEGLNILTGETGAGKSILIDSINAVTGEKTSRELIRTGEDSSSVSAFFEDISDDVKRKLSENGLPFEDDGTLLLQRTLYKDGKNACRINGMPVTVSMLKNIGLSLINIHGQRDSSAMLNRENHIDFLDEFAGLSDDVKDYFDTYKKLLTVKKEIKNLNTDEEYKKRRTELLKYQINELSQADIQLGERAKLTKKKNILNNSKKLSDALRDALNHLTGDGENPGAGVLISTAVSCVSSVSSLAKGLDTLSEKLVNAGAEVDDCVRVIDDVLSQLDGIDGNIDEIEARLDLLYKLSKKYGETEEEMLSYFENAKAELETLETGEEKLIKLNDLFAKVYKLCEQKANLLSEKRKKAAKQLSAAIQYELSFLDMPACKFCVEFSSCDMWDNGTDFVEFLISANPGEEPKPLGKVASGGELSRIMLALKNVLNKNGGVGTLIYDEIDAGVSGSAAGRIGVKLYEVSKNTQVLCITHLAQIAAFSDSHKFIYKEVDSGKTYTRIRELSESQRVKELARMTYGDNISEVHLQSANQMIVNAKEKKHK